MTNEKPKLALAVPVYGQVPSAFFTNFINLLFYLMQKYEIRLLVVDNNYVPHARNKLVDNFLETDCNYLFFMDSDMVVPLNVVEELMKLDKDVVSALYFQRTRNSPAFKIVKEGKYFDPTDYPKNSLIEVQGIGLGSALIKRKVIEKIAKAIGDKPFFDIVFNSRKEAIGEDIYFCNLIREQGFKIFVHTGIIARHFGGLIDEKYFQANKPKN